MKYKGMTVLASEPVVRKTKAATVEIGPPEVIAARDESPDEGTFVGPQLARLGDSIYLNWSVWWDAECPFLPDRPNGRVSHDAGVTWEKQPFLFPSGKKYQTGENEITVWFRYGFEVPGRPGVYRVPTWRSGDLGKTWGAHDWTTMEYPGTKGLDSFDPPEEFRKRDGNYLRGAMLKDPPAYLEPFIRDVSRMRGPGAFHTVARDPDGMLYGMVYTRYLADTAGIKDWDREFWQRLNWYRYAVLMQVSKDNGRTWTFAGVVADGSDYDARISVKPDGNRYNEDDFEFRRMDDPVPPGKKGRVDFCPGDGFSEPSLVIFPDGEMLCAMRTGGNKPLYCARSHDRGRTWTRAELLSPRYVGPICGVNPKLVLLDNGILALATGRPGCTVHFSADRGHTWFLSETLYTTGTGWEDVFSGSHTNVHMVAVDSDTLLYVHDATRPDPSAPNAWLRKAGHGLIIGRRIRVKGAGS